MGSLSGSLKDQVLVEARMMMMNMFLFSGTSKGVKH
jgi:hypothetical protein